MDFSWSEDQEALRELARKILTELATHERLKQVEAGEDGIDRELWQQLAQANLLGLALDEAHGGSGMGFAELCLLAQEAGRAVAQIPLVPVLVQAADGLQRFGSDAQRERWLPGVAKGEVFLTAALHEHGVEDPTRPTTSVRRDGDGFVLTGQKNFVSAAHAAARILVPATADDGEVLLFLVDPAAHGVTIERQRSTNKEALARLTLAGVAVAEADRVGEPGRGAAILRSIVDRNAAALCVLQLGVSERAIEITAEYGRTREQFDRPIGSFQAFHQRAADAYIQLEAQRLTAWEAVWRLAADEDAHEQLATARYWAVAGGQMAGYAAQHLHGGIGVDVDYPVHRHYQWTKQLSLLLGGRNAQLAAIGAELAR